jgi:hypothetical protein
VVLDMEESKSVEFKLTKRFETGVKKVLPALVVGPFSESIKTNKSP